MRVSDLYAPRGPFVGKEIYIVGLGASMNVFDRSILKGKTCILLNDTHLFMKDIGPIVLASSPEFIEKSAHQFKYKIVKSRLWKSHMSAKETHLVSSWKNKHYYSFSFRHPEHGEPDSRDPKCLFVEPNYYWTGGTVASYAIQFAAQAGATAIILVGCDCCSLMGLDYLDPLQRTLFYSRSFCPPHWASKSIQGRIKAWKRGRRTETYYKSVYEKSLVTLKSIVWKKFRIPIYTLTPFIGLNDYESQFKHFYREKAMRAFK